MKQFARLTTVALMTGSFLAGGCAFAQQSGSAQNNGQSNQSQYTGVSNPPDTPILANEPMTPIPPPQQQTQNKPSPTVPMQQPTPTLQTRQPAPVSYPAPAPANYSNSAANNMPTANTADNNESQYNNTDFGIVTQIPSQRAVQQVEAQDAQLENRSDNPADGIVSVVPFIPNALNPGTNITVRLLQPLSTSTTPQGTPFRATVVSNVYRGSQLVIPAGSELRGVVTDVHTGRHLISRATLRLTPQFVLLPSGKAYRLNAEAIYTTASHAKTTDEGAFQPTMHMAKDTAEYGAGAGLGALAGASFGPGGAIIGSLVGTGAVSAHMLLQRPDSLTLPVNSEVIFSLTQPMQLTPARE